MKIAFASLGAYGHLYPMMPLALASADAGHEVTIATGAPFLDRLPLRTMPSYPAEHDLDSAQLETRRRHPDAHGPAFPIAMFGDITAGIVARTLLDRWSEDRPDLVVFEVMDVGAGIAADVHGIPAAAFAIGLSPFIVPVLHGATVGFQREIWQEHGQTPPEDASMLAARLILPSPPTLSPPEPPAGVPVPVGVAGAAGVLPTLPIRPVAYSDESAPVPSWLLEPATRPRIYLTLGTVAFGAVEVLTRAAREISELDVDVLVAVGPEGDPSVLGELPSNVRLERFVAQAKVLPLVDLIVHHGGTGTVLGAAEVALPQLILPQGADQFVNARILSEAGAGRAIPNEAQERGAIRTAVEALLRPDAPERTVAARIRDEIATMPAPAEVVPALVELAAGVRS
jgi:UDP:flavonoid glycosyltransferase YjiC (YdhE family)